MRIGPAEARLVDGDLHDYLPDFIVRLRNGVHLILETKGHDPLEEVKAQVAQRWAAAVNAEGSYGGGTRELSRWRASRPYPETLRADGAIATRATSRTSASGTTKLGLAPSTVQEPAEALRNVELLAGADRGRGDRSSAGVAGETPRNANAMRMRGLEPPRGCPHTDLNRARLPVPPHPRGEPL